jgi:hypothetical protein
VRKKPAHFDWARTEPACFDWPVVAPNELRARREARAGYCLIDWDGVDALKEWQQHRCAVCGFDQDKLVVDHDHRTALVRGLLCSLCNHRKGQGGGALFDAYRARPPAVLLGVEEVYWSSWGGYYAEPASRATPSQ